MRLLWGLNHELESLSKRMGATFGVTGPQRLVLRIVGRRPKIAAGELAAVLHVHPSTLTGVLKRLTDRDLLERHRDPGDARRALFSLAPQGRAVDALRDGTVEAAISKGLRGLPADALATTIRVLERLTAALDTETRR